VCTLPKDSTVLNLGEVPLVQRIGREPQSECQNAWLVLIPSLLKASMLINKSYYLFSSGKQTGSQPRVKIHVKIHGEVCSSKSRNQMLGAEPGFLIHLSMDENGRFSMILKRRATLMLAISPFMVLQALVTSILIYPCILSSS
jgi:hypothetical protein